MRRRDSTAAALSVFALPLDRRHTSSAGVAAVRDAVQAFSRADERFGGGHARADVERYLNADVAERLHGTFTRDPDRRALTSPA